MSVESMNMTESISSIDAEGDADDAVVFYWAEQRRCCSKSNFSFEVAT